MLHSSRSLVRCLRSACAGSARRIPVAASPLRALGTGSISGAGNASQKDYQTNLRIWCRYGGSTRTEGPPRVLLKGQRTLQSARGLSPCRGRTGLCRSGAAAGLGEQDNQDGLRDSHAVRGDTAVPAQPTHLISFSIPTRKLFPGSVWHKRWLRTHLWMPLHLVRTFGNTAVLKAPAPLSVGEFCRRQEEKQAVLSTILQGEPSLETELSQNVCDKPRFIFTLGWGRVRY